MRQRCTSGGTVAVQRDGTAPHLRADVLLEHHPGSRHQVIKRVLQALHQLCVGLTSGLQPDHHRHACGGAGARGKGGRTTSTPGGARGRGRNPSCWAGRKQGGQPGICAARHQHCADAVLLPSLTVVHRFPCHLSTCRHLACLQPKTEVSSQHAMAHPPACPSSRTC